MVGPISAAIDASHPSFQLYKSGVYSEKGCSSNRVDHSLVIVGYDTLDGKEYWNAKNRWDKTPEVGKHHILNSYCSYKHCTKNITLGVIFTYFVYDFSPKFPLTSWFLHIPNSRPWIAIKFLQNLSKVQQSWTFKGVTWVHFFYHRSDHAKFYIFLWFL